MTRSPSPPSRSTTRVLTAAPPRPRCRPRRARGAGRRARASRARRAGVRPPAATRAARARSSSRRRSPVTRTSTSRTSGATTTVRPSTSSSSGAVWVTSVGSPWSKALSRAPLFVVAPAVKGKAATSAARRAAETSAPGTWPVMVTRSVAPACATWAVSSARNATASSSGRAREVKPPTISRCSRGCSRGEPGDGVDQVAQALHRVDEAEEDDDLGVGGDPEAGAGGGAVGAVGAVGHRDVRRDGHPDDVRGRERGGAGRPRGSALVVITRAARRGRAGRSRASARPRRAGSRQAAGLHQPYSWTVVTSGRRTRSGRRPGQAEKR